MGSEAKEGMLPATARSSHVDPGVKHTPGRSLRGPFLFWGAVPALQAPRERHQDSFFPLALGRVCLLMQKVPCEPLGDQGPGMQLELAGHGPGGNRACWAWILICKVSPLVTAGPPTT